MHRSGAINLIYLILLLSSLILSSCKGALPSAPSSTPESTLPVIETPQPPGERTLVYCMNPFDVKSLYQFANSGNLVYSIVAEAIYDGPIDGRSYAYQPVILKKLPSLADGDAQILPVEVKAGDRVVDVTGSPLELTAGVHMRPSGCRSDECAIEYDGTSPMQMDQLVVRFELLPGLLWSDGAPLTASDSVYSFNLQSDPDTPVDKDLIMHTASYQALDEHTSEWKGLPGYLNSIYFTNFFTPAPEHAWGQYTASELLTAEESRQKPLGWGPYVVEELDSEEGITLRKNENYFRKSEGLPHFDKLVVRAVEADLNANIALLLSGECDVLSQVTLSQPSAEEQEQLLELSNIGQITASFIAGTRFEHINFGILPVSYDDGWQPGDRPDFFSDVRVRRAFALCMDRQKMMQAAFSSQSVVPNAYLPPQHPLSNPDVTHYDFDPAAGAALLAEVGWLMGQDGVLVYEGDHPQIPAGTRFSVEHFALAGTSEAAVQVMRDSLKQCGIEINTSYWEGVPLFANGPEGEVFGRRFDLAQFRWLTGVQPGCNLYITTNIPGDPAVNNPYTGKPYNFGWGGQNLTGFSNAEYDQACQSALQALPGEPGYVENHMKAQEVYAEQLPSIPVYFNIYMGATRPDFCGYLLDPTTNVDTWNIEEFDYGPDC